MLVWAVPPSTSLHLLYVQLSKFRLQAFIFRDLVYPTLNILIVIHRTIEINVLCTQKCNLGQTSEINNKTDNYKKGRRGDPVN